MLGIVGELAHARCMIWPLSVQETPGSIYSTRLCHNQHTELLLHCQQQIRSVGLFQRGACSNMFTSTFSCIWHDCRDSCDVADESNSGAHVRPTA